MRKLCPNYDREDGLDTVLEVPIPEELFCTSSSSKSGKPTRISNSITHTWSRFARPSSTASAKNTELQLLLGVIGAPTVPLPLSPHTAISNKDPIEVSMAKYIVRQYVAAVGGERALDAVQSMYAVGKVTMTAFDFPVASGITDDHHTAGNNGTKKMGSSKSSSSHKYWCNNNSTGEVGEMGGFVLWQLKRPAELQPLWCLELVVAGCKISAGSDGMVAWRQTPWHPPHASRGPPRPLRRALQGLDPRSTARLFSSATCIGEKTVDSEACFVLRLDAQGSTLHARNSNNVEILRHTVWGYFSHRSGLLVRLHDSHLLRIKAIDTSNKHHGNVFWETTMESSIEDYRLIDGVYIAHAGRTFVSLFRFGNTNDSHTRTRMEEVWQVEEVEFNIKGLSTDCFLPPGDLQKDMESCGMLAVKGNIVARHPPPHVYGGEKRIGSSKVAAMEVFEGSIRSSLSSSSEEDKEEDEEEDEIEERFH